MQPINPDRGEDTGTVDEGSHSVTQDDDEFDTIDSGPQDTGSIAHVNPDRWYERDDEGSGANALDGGADDDLDDVYADPGSVVDDDLG